MKDGLAVISKDQILVLSQISLALSKRFNVTTSVFPGVKGVRFSCTVAFSQCLGSTKNTYK